MSAPQGPPPGPVGRNRQNDVLVSAPILTTFSTVFVVARLLVGFRNKKRFLLPDYLIAVGAILNIVAAAFTMKAATVGTGKHVWDPSMTPATLRQYFLNIWFSQLFNIYAMAVVKCSICAYIMLLDFTKTFRILVWISLVIHLALNFVFPSVILFGECSPIRKHWEPMEPGRCWPDTPRVVSGYLGAGTNIGTDLFYTSAPLVYLHSVQLAKRTKWGVRTVFLLGLITTVISALKFYEMKALNDSQDPSYESVDLTLFSMSEVNAGIFTASLPPLRKTFENFLRVVLPESIMGSSRKGTNNYAMHAYGSNMSTKPKHEVDDDSERAIFPDGSSIENKGAILRTTHVSITGDSQTDFDQMTPNYNRL